MSIKNAKNFNRGLKKLNSSYSNETTVTTATSSSLGLKGLMKRGMSQQLFQLEISAAGGQGGAGSPRGGQPHCHGGSGGGGGGGVIRYTTSTFDTIPYSIGASGTPRGGGGENNEPSPAPSGSATQVFGYTFGNGGNGATSAWGKHGNQGEPPCRAGSSGGGGGGGSVPTSFITVHGTTGGSTDSLLTSGQPGNPGNGSNSGYPACGKGDASSFGPYPIGGASGNSYGPRQASGFVQIRSANRFAPS